MNTLIFRVLSSSPRSATQESNRPSSCFTNLIGLALSAALYISIAASGFVARAATNDCVAPLAETVFWTDGSAGATNLITGTPPSYYNTTSIRVGTNSVLRLSGVSGSHIEYPDNPGLKLDRGDVISLEFWARTTNTSKIDLTLLDKRTAPDGHFAKGYAIWLENGRPLVSVASVHGAYYLLRVPSPDLRDGVFHHIVVNLDRRTNSLTTEVYVDGELLAKQGTDGFTGSYSNEGVLRIGQSVITWYNSYFQGDLDNIQIHRRKLTAQEVLQRFTACYAPPIDADRDGIPTEWETRFGLNPNDPRDAALDSDADGTTNLEEYASDTDPTSAASGFEISGLRVSDSGQLIELRVRSQAGTIFTLEDAPAPQGPWDVHTAKEGNGEVLLFTISDHLRPGQMRRYYRISAKPKAP